MHFTIKPVSFTCNLDCAYCFYLPKGEEQGMLHKGIMSDEVLEAFIPRYIRDCPSDHVLFTWQGGEPLLAGRKFFEKAFAIQSQYAEGKVIENAVQTNATLIDDQWCELFKKHKVLLGVSIDGPALLHDQYRKGRDGSGSHEQVVRGIELLKKHDIPFNTLTCISQSNCDHPLEVYNFLKELGSTFMQFSEVVETTPENSDFDNIAPAYETRGFSIRPAAYGTFMSAIFNEWIEKDIGKIVVRQFESIISRTLGMGHHSCVFENRCPDNFVLEANGDIYECDQAVYPRYRLANILDIARAADLKPLNCKVNGQSHSPQTESDQLYSLKPLKASRLRAHKLNLSSDCSQCPYLQLCNGGCIKHRIDLTGGAPKTYFCEGYKILFKAMVPYLNTMVYLEDNKAPYTAIKDLVPQIRASLAEGR